MSDNRAETVPPRVLTPEAQAALEQTGSAGGVTGPATFVSVSDPAPLDAKPPFKHELPDHELQVMTACVALLEKLDHGARVRAVDYLSARFHPGL